MELKFYNKIKFSFIVFVFLSELSKSKSHITEISSQAWKLMQKKEEGFEASFSNAVRASKAAK